MRAWPKFPSFIRSEFRSGLWRHHQMDQALKHEPFNPWEAILNTYSQFHWLWNYYAMGNTSRSFARNVNAMFNFKNRHIQAAGITKSNLKIIYMWSNDLFYGAIVTWILLCRMDDRDISLHEKLSNWKVNIHLTWKSLSIEDLFSCKTDIYQPLFYEFLIIFPNLQYSQMA